MGLDVDEQFQPVQSLLQTFQQVCHLDRRTGTGARPAAAQVVNLRAALVEHDFQVGGVVGGGIVAIVFGQFCRFPL